MTIYCVFFFSSRRRHTRSYGDWSSDVCSSDLQAALVHDGNLLSGVAQIGLGVEPEERRRADGVEVGDENRQVVGVDERVDGGEIVAERREPLRFDGRVVHAGGVVVGGLLPIRFSRVRWRGFKNAAEEEKVALLHFLEAADRAAVGGDRVLRDPAAAGVLIEVLARIGRLVERVQLYRAWRRGRLRRLHCFRCRAELQVRPMRSRHRRRQRDGYERQGDELAAHGFSSFVAKVQLVVGLQPDRRRADTFDELKGSGSVRYIAPKDAAELDATETREWLDSLDYVLQSGGPAKVARLLRELTIHARQSGVKLPFTASTPYINTISADEQALMPGSPDLERRIKSLVRWNAAAMVVRANKAEEGIGGHISTFASAATLYEVGFNHFFRGHGDGTGDTGDVIFFQGHAAPGIYA